MEKIIRNLLNKNNLEMPPPVLNEELYNWLEAAREKQNVRFVSDTPMPQKDLLRLKSQLGEVPSELAYYYARSTPWTYGIDDYFEVVNLIEVECISIFKKNRISEEEAMLRIREESPLWPVYLHIKGPTAVAFLDSIGRLCVVEASIRVGLGFGRPLSVSLRNYLVMGVISDLFWFESGCEISMTESMLNPLVLSIGEWPADEPPGHYMIDCFNLTNRSSVGTESHLNY